MNQRPVAAADYARARPAHPGRSDTASLGRGLGALLLAAACAFAQGPPLSGIERLITMDAACDLQSEDAMARGEAALLVAASGAREHEARLLELTEDPEAAARRRALIALGLLATPAAVEKLEAALQTIEARSSDDGVVAAYALGLVPVERAATSVARTLSLFRRGSWKRQHAAALALLRAMASQPERSELGALRLLRTEDSMRAGDLRGALLEVLLPIDSGLPRRELDRILRRGSGPERRALLRWISRRDPDDNASWTEELVRLADRDRDSAVRALALKGLARQRELRGMEIAARALQSASEDERRAAVSAMLAIGGASVRGVLEQHILRERDRGMLGALLEGFQAPPSQALVDLAATLAGDDDAPAGCRVAAAELLARSTPARAAPALQDLFRRVSDPALLTRVARSLASVTSSSTPTSRLVEPPATLAEDVPRWQALLAAGHADARRQVLAALQDRRAPPAVRVAALKAWRQASVLGPLEDAPPALAGALR